MKTNKTHTSSSFYYADNFFFREERANILSESTKTEGEGEDAEPTSFEDIGRLIGQRWRAIGPEELAKYKDMAKKDSERYRDEMKSFYNDELTLMCLGHNNEGASHQDNGNSGQDVVVAAGRGGGGRMIGESQQMANLLQQQHQQAMMSDFALRQDLMVMLAQEQARAGPRGTFQGPTSMNPYQAHLQPMNVVSNSYDPTGTAASLSSNNVMNEDQLLQLIILQQQQGATSNANGQATPNEALLKFALSQKGAVQERLDKLAQEQRALHIKRAILEKIVSMELGPTGVQSEGTRSSPSGFENLSVEELYQLLQHQAAAGLGFPTSASAFRGTPQPPGNFQMGVGGPSMQELFLRQQQANQASPHTNNIHQSYIAQFLAAQAPSQQMLDISGVPGMSGMGISGVPGSIGGMNGVPGMNVGMMSGGAPGATNAGIGVSNEDMIKKLMAEQSSQRDGNR